MHANLSDWRQGLSERFGSDQHLMNVIALRALKGAEVETNTCGRDASEHHAGMASRAGGALDANIDMVRQEIAFLHDASPQTGGSATLSVTGNAPWVKDR
jgi:hypothetical protein